MSKKEDFKIYNTPKDLEEDLLRLDVGERLTNMDFINKFPNWRVFEEGIHHFHVFNHTIYFDNGAYGFHYIKEEKYNSIIESDHWDIEWDEIIYSYNYRSAEIVQRQYTDRDSRLWFEKYYRARGGYTE